MKRKVKFGENVSLECIETILPRRLVKRVREESLIFPVPSDTRRTNMDVFVGKALKYYLKNSEDNGTFGKSSDSFFDDMQVNLQVVLPASLIVRLREKCSVLHLPRKSMKDVFIERALVCYLEFLDEEEEG